MNGDDSRVGDDARQDGGPAAAIDDAAAPATADEIRYREFKILLKPALFATSDDFFRYWEIAKKTAKKLGAGVREASDHEPKIRTVWFFDTPDADLYQSAFILRRRQAQLKGFPDPQVEIALKYRHRDLAMASAVHVVPPANEGYRVKFKEELLPGERPGEARIVYSHNAILKTKNVPEFNTVQDVLQHLPAVASASAHPDSSIELVSSTAIEEVKFDLAKLTDHGISANADISIWRVRATGAPLVAEFAYQAKFDNYEVHGKRKKARATAEAFFRQLQLDSTDWLFEGTTKTRLVYALTGRDIRSHE